MIRMQCPTPNRRGRYEIRDVPERSVPRYRARGWVEVESPAFSVAGERGPELVRPTGADSAEPGASSDTKTFDLTGSWFAKRAEVRDVLGMEKAPANKAEAAQLLRDAGYQVTGV